jgi:short subunit dehydrogenase-like uncharacterized protein
MAPRELDLVLFGATGFTGQLVAEHLISRYGVGRELRWALAGRNREKLSSVREALASIDAGAKDLPLLLADVNDRASLDEVARRARVVCTTVGPYALYGKGVVAACAEHGTSYCDLTGEPHFIREMIELHHERARATGARIVCCCGVDSIPFDLGVFQVQNAMRERHGVRCVEVKGFAGEMSGAFSGGTYATMFNMMEEATRSKAVRKVLGDPYSLTPGERGPDGSDQRGVRFDHDLDRWTAPFIMSAINTRVVRRSNALLGYPWGRDFRYSESMSMPAGPKGAVVAGVLSAGIATFYGLAALSPTRALLRKLLPGPGQGPSKEQRERGYFKVRMVGIGEARGDAPPPRLLGLVAAKEDPGYGATSRMLGESAVCLAKDALDAKGGVLTPASSMGNKLIDRLRAVGMTWDVEPLETPHH